MGRAGGVLAPAEQDFGHLGEALSRRQIAQPQVVVLGPAVVFVPAQGQDFPLSHHGRGVGDGALDEDFPGDILVAHQLVEPFFVQAESLPQVLPGKGLDEGADDADFGVLFQQVNLFLQALRPGQVVRVQARDQVAPALFQALVQGADQSPVRAEDWAQAGVAALPGFEDFPGSVFGAVVHGHDLELVQGLGLQALQGGSQRGGGIVRGHEDGDERCRHSGDKSPYENPCLASPGCEGPAFLARAWADSRNFRMDSKSFWMQWVDRM